MGPRWRLVSFCAPCTTWMGGRVVEGTGLENRHTGNGIVSSNLTPIRRYILANRNDTAFVATRIDEPDMSSAETCGCRTKPREW